MQLLNTLYVTLPDSYLRLDNDTLRVLAVVTQRTNLAARPRFDSWADESCSVPLAR